MICTGTPKDFYKEGEVAEEQERAAQRRIEQRTEGAVNKTEGPVDIFSAEEGKPSTAKEENFCNNVGAALKFCKEDPREGPREPPEDAATVAVKTGPRASEAACYCEGRNEEE